jgi:hypothetical protein
VELDYQSLEEGTSVININNSLFDSNICGTGNGGGAMYIYNATVNIDNCKFLNNVAAQGATSTIYGGAILVDSSVTLDVSNTIFQGNSGARGGAIAIHCFSSGGNSSVDLNTCTFNSNTASSRGHHLFARTNTSRTGNFTVTNCTFCKQML